MTRGQKFLEQKIFFRQKFDQCHFDLVKWVKVGQPINVLTAVHVSLLYRTVCKWGSDCKHCVVKLVNTQHGNTLDGAQGNFCNQGNSNS